MRMFVVKIIALAILGYLAYLAITCPCAHIWSCKSNRVWIAVILLIVLVAVEAGLPRFLTGSKPPTCAAN